MVGLARKNVQMSQEARMTTIDQIRPQWSNTISFERGLTSPVSYNNLELLARNALWGATSSYNMGPMQPLKPAGAVWDIARDWEALEPAKLAQRVTLDDFMKAYEAQNIDPVRLFRYYKGLGFFTMSKFSDKHCILNQNQCWREVLAVVHEIDDAYNS